MTWFLDPANPIWAHPIEYANQNTSGLASSQLALKLNPDAALAKKLHDRIEYLAANGQSPAGFFYGRRDGRQLQLRGDAPGARRDLRAHPQPHGVGMARKFADWFGYNMLREPDGSAG